MSGSGVWKRHLLLAGLVTAALLGFTGPGDATPCDPGAHWVEACPAGVDTFQSTAIVVVVPGPDPLAAGMLLNLSGPTTVARGNPSGLGHPETIPIEIVSMSLTGGGVVLTAGDGVADVANSGPLFSGGQIQEQGPDPFHATSFFDVFVTIDIPMLGQLHNTTSVDVQAVIDRTPPIGTPFIGPSQPVQLLDQHNSHWGWITQVVHTPVPEPSALILLGAGLVGAWGIAWRRSQKPRRGG